MQRDSDCRTQKHSEMEAIRGRVGQKAEGLV